MPDPSAAAAGAASLTKGRLLAGTMVPSTICGVLAIAVSLVRHRPIGLLFEAGLSAGTELSAGLLGGAGAGVLGAALLLRSKIFSDARALASSALASARPGAPELVAIAVAAGVGEELLFRGTLQPAWGLIGSSLIFTFVHFWVPIGGVARAIYIAFVFAVSLGLGWLFERAGLGAAMVAHATTDLTILLTARRFLA